MLLSLLPTPKGPAAPLLHPLKRTFTPSLLYSSLMSSLTSLLLPLPTETSFSPTFPHLETPLPLACSQVEQSFLEPAPDIPEGPAATVVL